MYRPDDHGWSVHTPILGFSLGFAFILKDFTAPSWRIHFTQVGLGLVCWFGLVFTLRLWALYTKRFTLLRKITGMLLVYNVRVDLMCISVGVVMLYYAVVNGVLISPTYLALGYAFVYVCVYWLFFARQIHLWVTLLERFDVPLD